MRDLRIDQLSGKLLKSLIIFLASTLVVACQETAPPKGDGIVSAPGRPRPAAPRSCVTDKFKQPSVAERLKKVDILFVMDHSGSMLDDWQRVATNISSLVNEVPADVDAQFAVVLGDVEEARAGKLYAAKNEPKVLSNKSLTNKQIGDSLYKTFTEGMKQADSGSGEACFFSLEKAVTTNAQLNQQLGFFRADAALGVVFMSDEQEIGFPFPNPQAPGLPNRCDSDYEDNIKKVHYDNKGVNINTAYLAVRNFKGDMPLGIHAFVNITKEDLFLHNDPKAACLYDSLGYGYFEMVQKANGILFSIQADKSEGLSRVGQAVNESLQLNHDFKLAWAASDIDPATIKVEVDGVAKAFAYDAATNIVHVDDAGVAESAVNISYCSPDRQGNCWTIDGFQAESVTTNSISLAWQTLAAETSGEVRYGLSANALNTIVPVSQVATLHSQAITNLQPDTDYYFQVATFAANGNGVGGAAVGDEYSCGMSCSEVVSKTIMVRTSKVIVPPVQWNIANINSTTTTNSIQISWETAAAATSGVVEWGLAADALNNVSSATQNGNSHSMILNGLNADTIYYFRIRATDNANSTQFSGVSQARTQVIIPPPLVWAVGGISSSSTTNAFTISWQTTGAATSGRVVYGLSANALNSQQDSAQNAESHSITVNGLNADTLYYARVESTDAQGVTKVSATMEIRTQPEIIVPPPADWQIVSFDGTTTPNSATLIWQTPGAATVAVVRVGTSAGDLTLQTVNVTDRVETHIITIQGLQADTAYFFEVTATDTQGRSVTSSVLSKRTKIQ